MSAAFLETGFHPQAEIPQYSERSLRDEIRYLQQNWQRENLPRHWRYLPGTGFDVHLHTQMLFNELHPEDTLEQRDEKLEVWFKRTDIEFINYDAEYLARGSTFPIAYRVLPEEGRVIDSLYEKDIEDIVSSEERGGVVKETIVKKLKPFFLDAPEGSVAVMTSPAGRSGLHERTDDPNKKRKEIIFPDSQTYVYQKVGNEILGFTFRTHMDLEEHREVIRQLSGVELSLDAGLEEYVASVALIHSQEDFRPEIRYVAEIMRRIRKDIAGKDCAWYDKDSRRERGWDEIFHDIKNRDTICRFRGRTKQRSSDLKHFVKFEWNGSQEELDEAVAVTLLRISKELRSDQIEWKFASPGVQAVYHTGIAMVQDPVSYASSYGAILKDGQELGGCNGGGQGGDIFTNQVDIIVNSGGVPRNATIEADTVLLKREFCIHCQGQNTDDHYHCEGKGGTGGCGLRLSSDRGKSADQRRKHCPSCKTKFNC